MISTAPEIPVELRDDFLLAMWTMAESGVCYVGIEESKPIGDRSLIARRHALTVLWSISGCLTFAETVGTLFSAVDLEEHTCHFNRFRLGGPRCVMRSVNPQLLMITLAWRRRTGMDQSKLLLPDSAGVRPALHSFRRDMLTPLSKAYGFRITHHTLRATGEDAPICKAGLWP